MAIYCFECPKCHETVDVMDTWDRVQNTTFNCSGCDSAMERVQINNTLIGKSRYQMQAVMADGREVKGHFGKEAPRNRK